MTLAQIAQKLKDGIVNNQLAIDNSLVESKCFAVVLNLMALSKIQYTNISQSGITLAGDKLTVTGTASLYGTSLPLVILIVGEDESKRTCAVNGTLPQLQLKDLVTYNLVSDQHLTLSSLPTFTFGSIALAVESENSTLTIDVASSAFTFPVLPALGISLTGLGFQLSRTIPPKWVVAQTALSITGNFAIGASEIDVSLSLPVGYYSEQDSWQLSFSTADPDKAVRLTDLIKLVGGVDLFQFLPPKFSTLGGFYLKNLVIQFDPVTPSVGSISLSIGTQETWTIVDQFTISNVAFSIQVMSPFKFPSVGLSVFGVFGIAGLPLAVLMSVPSGSSDWLVSMSTNLSTFPFSDMSGLPGGLDINSLQLPQGLSAQMPVTLNRLDVTFNPRFLTLNAIYLDIFSTKEWDIIPDKLTVGNPALILDITDPMNKFNKRAIGVRVSGLVTVAKLLKLEFVMERSEAGWLMSGRTTAPVNLTKFIDELFKPLTIDWPASLQNLTLSSFNISYATATKSFSVAGRIDQVWKYELGDYTVEIKSISVSYSSKPAAGNGTRTSEGFVRGEFNLFGLEFTASYVFSPTSQLISLEFGALVASYNVGLKRIEITFKDVSLGDMIALFIGTVTSNKDFKLPAPWSLLNTISLKGLKFIVSLGSDSQADFEFEYTLQSKIDLGFMSIEGLGLKRVQDKQSNQKRVLINIKGRFLGQTANEATPLQWDLLNDKPPAVPGMGDQKFRLDFLGVGQHVSLRDVEKINSVSQAIDLLGDAFKPPTDNKENPLKNALALRFNEATNWLIGAKFVVIDTVDVSVVFIDPELYGLLISLAGEKAKKFAGLRFEILYKKINDTIGVYQIELKLPDAMREMQFGAVSVTLPIVAVSIYTNGNFKIDFGFPAKGDFSRSFTVQVLPFIGAGGFYFAWLSNSTATRLPQHDPGRGTFNPVIEFGIGLQLGIGKTIDKGILKAGLSITFQGILEGTLAFFNPNRKQYPGLKDDLYYWLQGTFSVVGRIYGEINFAIIQARLDIMVYAKISVTLEAYKPIYLYFEAGVQVSLTVSINLGLFSIDIDLKFSAKISESFTIDTHQGIPPWQGQGAKLALTDGRAYVESLNSLAVSPNVVMNWKAIELAARDPLDIYFLQQFTVAHENRLPDEARLAAPPAQAACYVAALFLKSSIARQTRATEEDGFDSLAEAVLLWAISSLLNQGGTVTEKSVILNETITAAQLKDIYDYLTKVPGGQSPFSYSEVIGFLTGFFDISLKKRTDEPDFNVSVFPIIPELTMERVHNGNPLPEINFKTKTPVSPDYHNTILDYFKKLAVEYETELEKRFNQQPKPEQYKANPGDGEQSLSTFIFVDYFVLLARADIQSSIDTLKSYVYPIKATDTLNGIADQFQVTVQAVSTANQDLAFTSNTKLSIGGLIYSIGSNESFDMIAAKFVHTAETDYLMMLGRVNSYTNNILVPGRQIKVGPDSTYTVRPGDWLITIAKQFNTTPGEIVVLNRERTDILQQNSLLEVPISNIQYPIKLGDTFDVVANKYGVTQDKLADFIGLITRYNLNTPDLLVVGAKVKTSEQPPTYYTIQPRDTIDSAANANDLMPEVLLLLNWGNKDMLQPYALLTIPSVTYSTKETDNFGSVADLFNVSVESLGSANQDKAGLFPEGKKVVLPNLNAIKVGTLVDALHDNGSFKNLSGMAARTMLHGLRVPPPASVEEAMEDVLPVGLYELTGQQFTLPALQQEDEFIIRLTWGTPNEKAWFTAGNRGPNESDPDNEETVSVEIKLDSHQIDLVNGFKATTLDPAIHSLARMRIFKEDEQSFILSDQLLWQSDVPIQMSGAQGEEKPFVQPFIWNCSDELLAALNEPKVLLPKMGLAIRTQAHLNQQPLESPVKIYKWAAAIEVEVKQALATEGDLLPLPLTYDIVGANEAGIGLMEKIFRYQAAHGEVIDQIHILYPPNRTGDNPKGLKSDDINSISTFILQTNLSNFSRPVSAARARGLAADQDVAIGNLVNLQPSQSLKLIWECSIVRSGGYYLYYRNDTSSTGLPDYLFNEGERATLTLLVTVRVTGDLLPDFITNVVVGDRVGESSTLYAFSEAQTVDYSPGSGESFDDITKKYRINLTDLGEAVQGKNLKGGARLTIEDVIFELDNDSWTLEQIANRFGVSQQAIVSENPGVDFNELKKWLALNIPRFTYTIPNVAVTPTLADICKQFRIDLTGLVYRNRQAKLSDLFPHPATVHFNDQLIKKTATIPPGNTAFEVLRVNPSPPPRNLRTEDVGYGTELELLYNLMGYSVAANRFFVHSVEGMPVGPANNDFKPSRDPNLDQSAALDVIDPYWKYAQVLPVPPFVKTSALKQSEYILPDPQKNPYLGEGGIFQVHLAWQDMYGNQTYTPFTDPNIPANASTLNDLPIRIGYFDAIVGIERWPATNTGYFIRKDENNQPALYVNFSFDVTRYAPHSEDEVESVKNLALADLELFKTAYYQLKQGDTSVALTVTINTETYTVNKGKITDDFIGPIYDFLYRISRSDFAFTFYTTRAGDTLAGIAESHGVSVAALKRVNPGVSDPLNPNTVLLIPTLPLPADLTVSQAVAFTNTEAKFPLVVTLETSRLGKLIDDQFRDVPQVEAISYEVAPLLVIPGPPGQLPQAAQSDVSLAEFARLLEATFEGSKVALSHSKSDTAASEGNKKDVWIVRIGEKGLIKYAIDGANPSYFAPIPLANQLINGENFVVYNYDSGTGLDFGHPENKNYSGVDLDVWAKNFLAAVDLFLSPEYVVPAFIVDQSQGTSYYNQVIECKKRIAEGIIGLVQTVKAVSSGDPELAKEALKQQLLIELSNAYSIDTIAQFPVSVTAPPDPGAQYPSQLFGQPVDRTVVSAETKEYYLSTAKIPLQEGTSRLTFLFSTKRPKEHRSFHLDLGYKVNSIEYNIEDVPDIPDYKASSWLSFVLPLDQAAIGGCDMPVPLRAYPMPPSLIDQEVTKGPAGSIEFCDKEATSGGAHQATESLQAHAAGRGMISIADTRKWAYSYSYEKAEALQDTVYTNIRFNVKPPGQAFKESDKEPDLFESLAMFVNAYSQVQNDFVNVLANLNQQSSHEEIEIAKKAIGAFVFLVQKAANAWGRWLTDRGKYLKDLEVKDPYEFSVFESAENGRFKVTLTMTGTKDDIEMPLMVFKDYVPCFITDDRKLRVCLFCLAEDPTVFLSWETAQGVKQRQLEFSSLDIMKTQNAWAGIFVTRNENLFSSSRNIRLANAVERTNPNFIYQTPTVRFANLLTPLLDYKDRIDIATLDPPQPQFDYLINHLHVLFTKYFESVAEQGQVTSRKVKLSCSYLYSIGGIDGGLQEPLVVTLPVRLAPPFDFVIPDDCGKDCEAFNSFICRLSGSVLDWFRTNLPSRDGGEFLFDVATYSSLSDSKLPVYRLEGLYLKVADIKDLAPQEPA